MGFAQKGGSVLSFVRLADVPSRLNQVRIDTQQADAVLACDVVVGASPEALQTVRHGRTRILANLHEMPVAEALRNPDASLKVDLLVEKLRFVAGREQVETFDAQTLAEDFLGDTITANVLAMGFAWQRGLVPLSLAAMQHALRLNNVAVQANLLAFALCRLAAGDPASLPALLGDAAAPPQDDSLSALVARGMAHLTAYQDAAYASRYQALVSRVAQAEVMAQPGATALASAVARSALKLMAYKDEYEVARLYTDGAFQTALRAQFEGQLQLEFHMAPPVLAWPKNGQPPKKITLGPWLLHALRWLARGKRLRGGALDIFGRTEERRLERALVGQFEARVEELLQDLSADKLALATQIAAVPLAMRGYGHVKLANVVLARAREADLLHRFNPARYAKPVSDQPQAGQIRGIAVVAG